jgi:hypothetical protein
MNQESRIAPEAVLLTAVPPTSEALLNAWERSGNGDLAARVTALLGLVDPSATTQTLLEVPIGVRNRAILGLHLALVGPRAECVVHCTKCRELNELSLQVRDLMVTPGITPPQGFCVHGSGWSLRFRLPNTADFVRALTAPTLGEMRRIIVERCTLAVELASQAGAADDHAPLPEEAVEAVSQALGRVDPAGELVMRLTCVNCGHRFVTLIDPTHLLWEELGMCCQRVLAEVDAIARVYHWSEREILAMTPQRRSSYLNMVSS